MRLLVPFLLFLTAGLSAATSTVKTVGIRVATPPTGADGKPILTTILGSMPGTDLALLVTSPEPIARLAAKQCTLDSAVDDLGTDLSKEIVEDMFHQPPLARISHISEDRKQFIVDWRLAGVPAAGSQTIQVKGTLMIYVGGQMKTAVVKLPLTKNAETTVQGSTWAVTDIADSDWDEGFKEVMLKVAGASLDIESIDVLGADGAADDSAAQITDSGNPTALPILAIPPTIKELVLKVRYRRGAKLMAIPIDVDTGLGVAVAY